MSRHDANKQNYFSINTLRDFDMDPENLPNSPVSNVDFTIVIPFRNEEPSLRQLLPEIKLNIDAIKRSFEVIFVDDASSDNGANVIREFARKDNRFSVSQLEEHGGQTEGFRRGFSLGKGNCFIRMDADLQDNPDDLIKLLQKIDEGSELVIGVRDSRKHSLVLRILTNAYDAIVGLVVKTELHSNSASLIAFKAEYVKEIPFVKNDHRYLPLIAIRRGAKSPSSVRVNHRTRQFGRSNYRITQKLMFGLFEVGRFLWRYYRGYYDLSRRRK